MGPLRNVRAALFRTSRSAFCVEKWRRGSESNTPRPAQRADDGFEDRGGHQAPITLRAECSAHEEHRSPRVEFGPKKQTEGSVSRYRPRPASDSDSGFDLLEEDVEVGKFSRFGLGMQLVAIDGHLKDAAAGGHQLQRTDSLFQGQQCVRQTDGSRFVVSGRAVLDDDLDAHGCRPHTLGQRRRSVKSRGAAIERRFEKLLVTAGFCATTARKARTTRDPNNSVGRQFGTQPGREVRPRARKKESCEEKEEVVG